MSRRNYENNLRERARELRQHGLTYTEIIKTLGDDIPKSTLNNWLSDIELTPQQIKRIKQKERNAILQSQPLAVEQNKEGKRRRLAEITSKATPLAKRLAKNKEALMLMASALYMGEGAKAEKQFSLANSNPRIIQAWLAILRNTFDIDEQKFRCQLMITEGMDESALKDYWATITRIPLNQFNKSGIRKDSGGRKREGYHGVCVVNYYSLEVRRMLDAIGEKVIDELLEGTLK